MTPPSPSRPRQTVAVQVWLREELEWAQRMWPSLFDMGLPPDYWSTVEHRLRDARGVDVLLVPVRVEALSEFVARTGGDVDDEAVRQEYAEERVALGDVLRWPPRPDDDCWCGSGTSYRRCCRRGAASPAPRPSR